MPLPFLLETRVTEEPPDGRLLALLPEESLKRARNYGKPLRQSQHLWARVLILAAGRLLGGDGARITLAESPPASPALFLGGGRLFTSISHSRERVIALVDRRPCAVDIEKVREGRDFARLAETAFGPEAAGAVGAADDPAAVFHRAWGAKECAVKLGSEKEFRLERGVPAMPGFSLECSLQGGWTLVTALVAGRAAAEKRFLSAEDAAAILLGRG